jgi:hypothetical protein
LVAGPWAFKFARGEGFMTYAVASARLKRALIPMLVGKSTGPMRSIFE